MKSEPGSAIENIAEPTVRTRTSSSSAKLPAHRLEMSLAGFYLAARKLPETAVALVCCPFGRQR